MEEALCTPEGQALGWGSEGAEVKALTRIPHEL